MTVDDIKRRRTEDADRLCKALGTSKMFLFDPLMSFALGYPCIYPEYIERFLAARGHLKDGESIRECLERVYGKDVAELAESLI